MGLILTTGVVSFVPVDYSGQGCIVQVARYPPEGYSMESWYNVWVAGIDVFTMCIQRGMTGTVFGLGMSFLLFAKTLASTVSLQWLKPISEVRVPAR